MYIILMYLLSMRLGETWCKPLKFNEPMKSSNTITEDSKNRYFWTMRQLQRCYLWSSTLPFEKKMDYLITLQRKVNIST